MVRPNPLSQVVTLNPVLDGEVVDLMKKTGMAIKARLRARLWWGNLGHQRESCTNARTGLLIYRWGSESVGFCSGSAQSSAIS